MNSKFFIVLLFLCTALALHAQYPDEYNIIWDSPSSGSHESMPCGGGSIGMNVWVEEGNLYFYFSRSGTFDENNAFLKGGRIRLELSPNPFLSGTFRQELKLNEGYIEITAGEGQDETCIELWADVFNPVIHLEINSKTKRTVKVSYESWRHEDHLLRQDESHANSYKFAPPTGLKITKDNIDFHANTVEFYHRNPSHTVFDVTVGRQGMDSVKNRMMNPLANLTFGGRLSGKDFVAGQTYTGVYKSTPYKGWILQSKSPGTSHHVTLHLHTAQAEGLGQWESGLSAIVSAVPYTDKKAKTDSRKWWKSFWQRSFIRINPGQPGTEAWNVGRNYQLFRYMLGCNAYGSEPTKFNGGLFTFDPVFVDPNRDFTPDFRLWGGGTMTAQNQRLIYFPLIKSGDFDILTPQFNFYKRMLSNAELRSQVYWGHNGACFAEQIENFGLPNVSENEWQPRRQGNDLGVESNPWLEYCWDTALEFGLMMLDASCYSGESAIPHLPFIESTLTFFDEHYRYLAAKRGTHDLDGNGHLILYPGSGCETYKMATNATSTVAALETVLKRLLALNHPEISAEQQEKWKAMLGRIPPIIFREIDGKKLISPAKAWERVNNEETPQLYPVYPWRIYGVGRPDIQVAIDTYFNDPDALKFRNHIGWKQDNIFAACLGLSEEAKRLTLLKFKDGPYRFPSFWGPGFDWSPDHNWGGSAMIGLQEMLLQTLNEEVILFPAWPKEWSVHFKLHAPNQTTVEAKMTNGATEIIKVHSK
ncbi:hypothetical protein M2459_001804 [Parabacteroides sp. PF5-5]|uniref:DUF5703 domain-containing protein n=1 Tax=unclassified Parabacteroides TaxID=2649774 RepID=UPI002473C9FB|nr:MULTISPECIES: DUF5703 domain-containing protein [unclassified Parabacteroides]MDH6305067.1 hypothetical protein [Parabacteroides sp. PH5-39]MDH6315848.1 hypothetical protein [Parabacteroides sp. PF5-13]MDH6319505.1 hypothetical protein [Parabacteroides sp. PH5-13]MDH6323236.1 hypothetical protein [Parabacteroides sp. PH5-8]MDH6327256.1 hypothetical protein [Parabacteroides sp. PH5-41]